MYVQSNTTSSVTGSSVGWQSQSQGHLYCKINVGIQNGEINETTVFQGNEANMLGVKCGLCHCGESKKHVHTLILKTFSTLLRHTET
jgi:hypothetical protein